MGGRYFEIGVRSRSLGYLYGLFNLIGLAFFGKRGLFFRRFPGTMALLFDLSRQQCAPFSCTISIQPTFNNNQAVAQCHRSLLLLPFRSWLSLTSLGSLGNSMPSSNITEKIRSGANFWNKWRATGEGRHVDLSDIDFVKDCPSGDGFYDLPNFR